MSLLWLVGMFILGYKIVTCLCFKFWGFFLSKFIGFNFTGNKQVTVTVNELILNKNKT